MSNRTLTVITTTIDPWVLDMVATCGGTLHELGTPMTKGVITDVACSSAQIICPPENLGRTGRAGTTPHDCDVAVRPPRRNWPVLIGGIVVPPTMGHSWSKYILNKRLSTSPSVSRNNQKLDTSADGSLADYRDSTTIFGKIMG